MSFQCSTELEAHSKSLTGYLDLRSNVSAKIVSATDLTFIVRRYFAARLLAMIVYLTHMITNIALDYGRVRVEHVEKKHCRARSCHDCHK